MTESCKNRSDDPENAQIFRSGCHSPWRATLENLNGDRLWLTDGADDPWPGIPTAVSWLLKLLINEPTSSNCKAASADVEAFWMKSQRQSCDLRLIGGGEGWSTVGYQAKINGKATPWRSREMCVCDGGVGTQLSCTGVNGRVGYSGHFMSK